MFFSSSSSWPPTRVQFNEPWVNPALPDMLTATYFDISALLFLSLVQCWVIVWCPLVAAWQTWVERLDAHVSIELNTIWNKQPAKWRLAPHKGRKTGKLKKDTRGRSVNMIWKKNVFANEYSVMWGLFVLRRELFCDGSKSKESVEISF